MRSLKIYNYIKYLLILLMLSGIIYIIIKMASFINGDEPFTMALISHNYIKMIHISYFDVHPPLYYIILKTWVLLTSFWTNSIVIKIFSARLLSIICLVCTSWALISLLKVINIHVHIIYQLIFYLSTIPTLMYSLRIRMYEMAVMFISIELLYLLKFIRKNKKRYLIITILFSSLASYTHYYAAIFAGSLLFTFMVTEIHHHNYDKALHLLLSGICFALLFIPCIHFATRQLLYAASSQYNNNIYGLPDNIIIKICEFISGLDPSSMGALLFSIIASIITIYLTIFNWKVLNTLDKTLIFNLISVFIIGILITIIFQSVSNPTINGRYFYPLISIYEFLIISFTIYNYKKTYNSPKSVIPLFLIIIVIICGISANDVKDPKLDIDAINAYRESRDICSYRHTVTLKNPTNFANISVYIKDYTHPAVDFHNVNPKDVVASNNMKLIRSNFNNIHIHIYRH